MKEWGKLLDYMEMESLLENWPIQKVAKINRILGFKKAKILAL
jgi:hypothetical protein